MKLNVHLLKFNTNSQKDLSLFPKKVQNFKTTPESYTFCYLNKHICIVHLEYKSSLQTNYQVYHIAIVLTAVLSKHTIRFIIPESKKLYSLIISVQEVQFPFNIPSYYTYLQVTLFICITILNNLRDGGIQKTKMKGHQEGLLRPPLCRIPVV